MYTITGINVLLCVIILILGYLGYAKTKDKVSLYIGIAFGIFGISHFIIMVAPLGTFGLVLALRLAAYFTVMFCLYNKFASKQ